MSVVADIALTWRAPRRGMRRLLAQGQREDRALAYLMIGCTLIFVSAWPMLARQAAADPSMPLDARLGGALLAWLGMMPLVFYGIAALSHLIARGLGGRGTFFGARLALFWALLAASPAWLAQAAIGSAMPGPAAQAAAALALFGLLWLWLPALAEAERGLRDAAA
ncbi:MAG: YIP1 family protein [Gammaproteobacteria bacterium]|nr:YIP1 family protein [Gammaproteobacteria bacterium]